ncbi:MAG: BCCT family transporter [Gammaproteobacteria bacterium]|nr:BCCT family transporter [Gammaproteobacteria bacterium]
MPFVARILEAMEPAVFIGSALAVVSFVTFGSLWPETASDLFHSMQGFIVERFGWFYVLTASTLLVAVLWLMVGPYGRIRLGGEDSRPEFGYLTWFSMMLSAGMGIGIVFFGVAEPLQHFVSPPMGEGATDAARREAMRFTFFHWGLHPWAIYCAIALPLAYFHFRHDLPLAPRSLLYPLIGERIHGPIGHGVDILCTVGTLFGVATSLGLGALQINAGLHHIAGVEQSQSVQIALILGITAVATVSVVSGLHLGMRFLSEFNVGLSLLILTFVFVAGPTLYILDFFVTSIGYYLQKLPLTSLWVEPGEQGGWQTDWTLFYWSWWISWSPFVGVFISRISKGRTIREFIAAAMLVPTVVVFFWFSVMGGTAIRLYEQGHKALADTAANDSALAFYALLEQLPLTSILSVLVTLLILTYFVTSSDSGSLVDDMVTSGGHPNPPRAQRVFWAVSEGMVAAVLLTFGGLQALRAASLTVGLPMSLLLLVAMAGLMRALAVDAATKGVPKKRRLKNDD